MVNKFQFQKDFFYPIRNKWLSPQLISTSYEKKTFCFSLKIIPACGMLALIG